jgi:hypothetical protein
MNESYSDETIEHSEVMSEKRNLKAAQYKLRHRKCHGNTAKTRKDLIFKIEISQKVYPL